MYNIVNCMLGLFERSLMRIFLDFVEIIQRRIDAA
jgi:hypothetical protein